MATHGSVSPFNPEKEKWSAYVEHLDYYLVANGKDVASLKCLDCMVCVPHGLEMPIKLFTYILVTVHQYTYLKHR